MSFKLGNTPLNGENHYNSITYFESDHPNSPRHPEALAEGFYKIPYYVQNDRPLQSGRTLVEILGLLSVIGLLSGSTLVGYSNAMRRKNINAILNELQQKVIEINSTQINNPIIDLDEFDDFLEDFTTTVGEYKLSFYSTNKTDGSFLSEITKADGTRIKGKFCRELITKMAEQKFVEDIDFLLEAEPQENGSTIDIAISLNGKLVNLKDICGE